MCATKKMLLPAIKSFYKFPIKHRNSAIKSGKGEESFTISSVTDTSYDMNEGIGS